MKILVIGPGESTPWLFNQKNLKIPEDVKTFGLHRVFPHISKNLDFWTWGDPDASMEGLNLYINSYEEEYPQIIVPHYMKDTVIFSKNCGTSPLTRNINAIKAYNSSMQALSKEGKITYIDKCRNTRTLPKNDLVFNIPEIRFNSENTYFGTVPCDGIRSEFDWAMENKFTFTMLPICHYLGATEVYCIGFDNQGTGFAREIPQFLNDPSKIEAALRKYLKWTEEWKDLHNMKIYSIIPDKFSPVNSVMEFKTLEELGWIE